MDLNKLLETGGKIVGGYTGGIAATDYSSIYFFSNMLKQELQYKFLSFSDGKHIWWDEELKQFKAMTNNNEQLFVEDIENTQSVVSLADLGESDLDAYTLAHLAFLTSGNDDSIIITGRISKFGAVYYVDNELIFTIAGRIRQWAYEFPYIFKPEIDIPVGTRIEALRGFVFNKDGTITLNGDFVGHHKDNEVISHG